jgi:predicted DNA-binding protein
MATDRCARLKAEIFKELQMLKATWHRTIIDLAQLNSEDVEEVVDEFEDLFLADEEIREWDEEDGIPELG